MRVAEGGDQRADEEDSGDVADEIAEYEHGAADGEKLRGARAAKAGFENVNQARDGAGVFESLHDHEKRGEEKKQFPIHALIDVFGFDAADDENDRAGSGCSESEREIHKPQNENEHGGGGAFREQRAIDDDGILRRMIFQSGSVEDFAMKNNGKEGDVEQQTDDSDGSEMHEEIEESEMRGDTDERVLRIAGDGHDRADVGGSGERDEVWEFGQTQAIGDGENDGREHEAHGVVDEKCGEDSGGEYEKGEKLEGRFGNGGDAGGDPVEEMRDLKMSDENHDAQKKNYGVPTDGAIGSVERDDPRENHGHSAAERRGGAVEVAAASAFDGDEDVGDEENDDGEPVQLREEKNDGKGLRQHAEVSLTRFAVAEQCALGCRLRPLVSPAGKTDRVVADRIEAERTEDARVQMATDGPQNKTTRGLTGPDFVGIGLVWIDVDHPVKDERDKVTAGSVAGFFGGDAAVEAEFCVVDLGLRSSERREAEIHVFVPASDTERDALVELIVGVALGRGVHGADELVAVADFFIKKRSGARGIEGELRAKGVAAASEVINRLADVGRENFEAVGEGDVVVLVFRDGGTKSVDDLRGAGLVGGVGLAQSGHEHVSHVHVHVGVHVGHIGVGGASGRGVGICGSVGLSGGRVHARHVGHAGRGFRRRRGLRLS
jgi:hypothetical protein